ncbi:MAG TPA: tetratricopeptide repeat protein [Polyangiaceae bacterium]|nr:tetratricopeptide repeat protein [Polyangiaceae bacterium]
MSRHKTLLHGLSAALLGALVSASALGAPEGLDALKARGKAAADPTEAMAAARALRRAGLLADALTTLQKALGKARGEETVAAVRLELARTYLDQRQPKRALNQCDQIHKLAPRDEQLCIAEASLYQRRGSIALPAAEAVLAATPGHYDGLVAKGRALSQLGKPEEAEAALRQALKSDATRTSAPRYLAELLIAQGKSKDATALLTDARRVDGDDPDVLVLYGEVLPPGAESKGALEHALSVRPSDARAKARLGQVLLALGEPDRAEKLLDDAVAAEPRQAEWFAALGEVEIARKQPDLALRAARSALAIVGNLGPAKLAEAKALAMKGDIDLAIESFEAAYGFSRVDPSAPIAASRACLEGGRLTTAKAFADRATEDFPKSAAAWEILGDVHVALKEPAEAKKAYQAALAGEGPVDKDAVRRKLGALK